MILSRLGSMLLPLFLAAAGSQAAAQAYNPSPDPRFDFIAAAAGCESYQKKRDLAHNQTFLGDVVKIRDITLLGDHNHMNPHLVSYVADAGVVEAWAKNGVTDVYLEVHPVMHERIAPFLQPFDRAGIVNAFATYHRERGLYNKGAWADRRAEYMAAFIESAEKNGIYYHFFSEDPALATRLPDMMDLYVTYTQAKSMSCNPNEGADRFKSVLSEAEKQEFALFTSRLLEQRLRGDTVRARYLQQNGHGGHKVVIFGEAHFDSDRPYTLAGQLGRDNVTYVRMCLDNMFCVMGGAGKTPPDFAYDIGTGRALGRRLQP